MQQSKRSTIWTHGEQPKHIQNQWRSALIFKREAPKRAGPRAFARFGQWLIRPCGRYPSGKQIAQLFCQASFGLASTTKWSRSVAYAENFHGVGFIQWRMVVICIWCALFVTSQFDIMFMFPNQGFGEVCWHNIHILLHALPLFYKLSALQVRISEENTLNATTQQFITAKISGDALKQGSKTHSSLPQSNLQMKNEAALSGVTRGLSQGVQSLAEGGPLTKTQKKVKKW